MIKELAVSALLLLTVSPIVLADSFGGVQYQPPEGWTGAQSDGWQILRHPESPLMIVVGQARPLAEGDSFEGWFARTLDAELVQGDTIIEKSDDSPADLGEARLLMRSISVQGQAVTYRIYCGVMQDKRVALAMAITTDHQVLQANNAIVSTLFGGLRIPPAQAQPMPQPVAAPPQPPSSPQPANPVDKPRPKAGEAIPKAELTSAGPQGVWIGISIFTGRPVYLTFLADGRAYRGMLFEGMNTIDWAAIDGENRESTGKWSFAGDVLTIRWNDEQQNVWQSAVQRTPRGMVFDEKRYWPAQPVAMGDLPGKWVSTAGTRPGGAVTVV
jgi:hypothetical protein